MSSSGISWAIWKSAPSFRQITMPALYHSVFCRPEKHVHTWIKKEKTALGSQPAAEVWRRRQISICSQYAGPVATDRCRRCPSCSKPAPRRCCWSTGQADRQTDTISLQRRSPIEATCSVKILKALFTAVSCSTCCRLASSSCCIASVSRRCVSAARLLRSSSVSSSCSRSRRARSASARSSRSSARRRRSCAASHLRRNSFYKPPACDCKSN